MTTPTRRSISAAAFLAALLAWGGASFAQDPTMTPAEPPPIDHHEFNASIPTTFDGEMVSRPMAADGAESVALSLYAVGDPASDRQIIVIHEWWGLNEHVKGVADQFAKLGYRAYAVDLYGGQSAGGDPEQARALMGAANKNPERLRAYLKETVALAGEENAGAKLATIGWCFGGGWSLQCAIRNPEVDACVVYYGQLVVESEALEPLAAPVLAVIAEKDGWITPAMGREFVAAMTEAGKSAQLEIYPADHAFANPSGQRYSEPEARDAWAKTMAFLDANMAAE